MRDPNRLTSLYKTLESIHKDNIPDWRFLQFMENFISFVKITKKIDPFFVEDDELLALIAEFFGPTPDQAAGIRARASIKKK